jgi:hypothetical protein
MSDKEKSDKSESKETKEETPQQDEETLPTLSESCLSLLGSESFADVHFSVKTKDGKTTERIPAHRLFLASNNLVFQALLFPVDFGKDSTFTYNANKNDEKDIVVEGVHPDSFKKMLRAIYSDEIEITAEDDLQDLIKLAKDFQVDSLRLAVVGFMEDEVTADNACKRFEEGRKLLNEASFGLKYIEENASDVFESEEFENLTRESIAILLKSNNLCIEEADVVKSVLKWAAAECKRQDKKPTNDNKREILGDIVNNIRFGEMNMNEIVAVIQSSGIMSQEDLLSLYTYVGASKDSKPKVKFNTKPREGGGHFKQSRLLTPQLQKVLSQFYSKEKKSVQWVKVFDSKTDSLSYTTFHSKCDNVGPTMSIMKSSQGNIFGGFTEKSWSGSGNYQTDPKAFLFSLVNSHKKPCKLRSTSDSYSVYAYSTYGPTFGGGHNLCVNFSSNYCSSYASYVMEDTSLGFSYDTSLLAGSSNFTLSDMEVYAIKKSS